jgi:hypothetical protein
VKSFENRRERLGRGIHGCFADLDLRQIVDRKGLEIFPGPPIAADRTDDLVSSTDQSKMNRRVGDAHAGSMPPAFLMQLEGDVRDDLAFAEDGSTFETDVIARIIPEQQSRAVAEQEAGAGTLTARGELLRDIHSRREVVLGIGQHGRGVELPDLRGVPGTAMVSFAPWSLNVQSPSGSMTSPQPKTVRGVGN